MKEAIDTINSVPNGHALSVMVKNKPFISIIIATHNEEKYICSVLDSLLNQVYGKDNFEVIIVDGMSTDKTLDLVEYYKHILNLVVIKNERIKSTFAFNLGLDISKGDLFMIINAHSILEKNFIEEDIITYNKIIKSEPKLAGVGGIYINKYENSLGRIINLLYSSPLSGARTPRFYFKPHFSDSIIFGVFNKQIVIENGKFDEDFLNGGNDDELTLRLIKKGYKFYTNPKIIAYYSTRNSFNKFIKQTYNYGIGKGLIVRKGYHDLNLLNTASLFFVPFSFLIYELIFLMSIIIKMNVPIFSIPFIVYLIVNLFNSIYLIIKTHDIYSIILPFFYFIFHNVLGLSSMLGILLGKKGYIN